ncbi:5S rRNA maturation endonuclease (ribonuclease M5) [Brevibacillus aydinogluensis]|uniref:DEAD/DEAH box helicase n=1 Tax=Brevibacillus aydinogluensis TaxID=927786 RepID=UPI0028931592|nr:DEAD/DEAH box helicase [Brevibacillus aydinogluensis]MDT3417100.1 5S rRNA maturation endonuclease (ribonuclease M5) [Brevibacillus aydinogluensis]
MKISLTTSDRYFEAVLHFAVIERDAQRKCNHLIAASYVGLETSVRAVSAGFVEGREVQIESLGRFARALQDKYRRIERPIGLGDVVHGIVLNARATFNGLEEAKDSSVAYIFARDGDLQKAIGEHVASRFGMPREWVNEYHDLLRDHITPLQIIHNSAFQMWSSLQVVKLSIDEESMKNLVSDAIKAGRLEIPPSIVSGEYHQGMTMQEYLRANATILAEKLNEKQPRHSPDKPLSPFIATMKRIPFPAQAHMIQGLVNTLKHEKSVFTCADMGTGKSIQAVGVAHVLHETRKKNGAKRGTAVLLSAPGITIPKWAKKEIGGTVNAKTEIINSSEDALRLLCKIRNGYKPTGLEFWLVGIDRAKLSSEPYFAGVWKRKKGTKHDYAWHCPECSRPLERYDQDLEQYVPMQWYDCAESPQPSIQEIHDALQTHSLLPNGLPKGYEVKWKRSQRVMECTHNDCSCKLWRPAVKSRGETRNKPRVNISRVLKKSKKFFDLLIVDEVHQCKADGSGRGDALHQLVGAAKRNLLLTGTLVNGKSTSIKEILWRTDAKSLLAQGFDRNTGMVQWAERYGKLKEVVTIKEVNDGWVTRQKRVQQQPTEEPGIAPQLTAQFLLHKAGFLELPDMGLPLVELKEIPIFIDMDGEHGKYYSTFHNQLQEECKKRSMLGVKGAWSKFIPSTINYADAPHLGGYVEFGACDDDDKGTVISAPALAEDYYHAKERKLVKLVKQELSEGRGVVIYNNYTDSYGMNERTKAVLKAHGIDATILDEPSPDKRQERIDELAAKNVKVIITNMKLVEVGLDLLPWPTIIFNQLNYEVSTVRQAARRAWRIGQEREARVFYLVYNGTQQMAQFLKIMSARGHAMMVEGRLDKSALAQYSRDSQSALASDLANCFAGSDVAEAWTRLAAKDIEGVETINEAEFKTVLKQRMEALANETRRLCGYPPVLAQEEVTQPAPQAEVIDLQAARDKKRSHSTYQSAEQLDLFELYELKVVEFAPKRKKVSNGQLEFDFGL